MVRQDEDKRILILGAGGHAKSVIDTIERQGIYEIAGVVDNETRGRFYKEYDIIGTDEDLPRLFEDGIHTAFVGIGYLGDSPLRNRLYKMLKEIGFELAVVVDPSAVLANDVSIGEGTFVGKLTVINSNARIEAMSIINTAAVIEHDCVVGAFSHISVRSTVCGVCVLEDGVLVGAGAVLIQGLSVGKDAIIAAGAAVTRNVEPGVRVMGVPAK